MAMVFQSYALFPHLSVAENIVFGLRVRRVPAAERDAAPARVAELLGLDDLLERKPSQLSGGQQQRVALGRAIIAREAGVPDGRAAVEPRRAAARTRCAARSAPCSSKLGITMVYVTHDQTEAMTHGRPGRPAARGARRAGRRRRRALRAAGHRVRRALHRHAADEPAAARARARGRRRRGHRGAGRSRRRRAPTACSACGPRHIAIATATACTCARVDGVEYLGADSIVALRGRRAETLAVRAPGRVDVAARRRASACTGPPGAQHCLRRGDGRRAPAPESWPLASDCRASVRPAIHTQGGSRCKAATV